MVFSLNSTFGYNHTSRNKFKESDFYDKYWNKDTCNPKNWKSPSTFDVEGAWLVDKKGNVIKEGDKSGMFMRAFNTSQGVRDNPTKAEGNKGTAVKNFGDMVKEKKFKTLDPMYFNYKNGADLNGGHREEWGRGEDMLGWMSAGLIFDTKFAEIEFMNLSNVEEREWHQQPTYSDVVTTVKLLLDTYAKETGTYNEDFVRALVQRHGKHLESYERQKMTRDFLNQFLINQKVTSSDPFQSFEFNKMRTWFASDLAKSDPWYTEVYNNPKAQWMYVNLADGKDRIYVLKLLERSYDCICAGVPLHLLINVQLPKNGNITQLDENRRKFFTEFLSNIEYWVNGNSGVNADIANRLRFAWNHPDCRHVTFPQARAREFGKFLIELKGLNTRGNYTFN